MKKVLTSIATVLLLSIICLTLLPQNVLSKTQDIKVLNYSHYIDNLGYLDICGEIQNVGTATIKRAVLTITVYGADGTNQGTVSGYAWLSYMAPQQKSPFLLDIRGKPADYDDWYTAGVSKIDISVREADETNGYLYSDFEVSVSSAGVSTSEADKGAYWVSGAIKNIGSQTASKLAAAAIFYNSAGGVVAVGRTDYLTPTDVRPSGVAMFKLGAFDTNQTIEPENRIITSYALFVQADSPLMGGNAPVATAPLLGSSQPIDLSGQSSNQNFIYILVIVAVVVAVVAALLMSRKGKPSEIEANVKETSNKKMRMFEDFSFFL
ncbi:MAG: FxLYD domain-containing protein [Candidatus Bathyarchaeota archaeon]|nr:FxLYD domain-containing protein [Candidatus Termiticorpusculum sp.]